MTLSVKEQTPAEWLETYGMYPDHHTVEIQPMFRLKYDAYDDECDVNTGDYCEEPWWSDERYEFRASEEPTSNDSRLNPYRATHAHPVYRYPDEKWVM